MQTVSLCCCADRRQDIVSSVDGDMIHLSNSMSLFGPVRRRTTLVADDRQSIVFNKPAAEAA